tara:strand:- start:5450 stop:5680 length:231 start_codon:yes stop_codon:yes gene_type:complete
MANNKKLPNPNDVTRLKEPATSNGTWKRYKTSTTGRDSKTGFEDPLKGYPYNNGDVGTKIQSFAQWNKNQTPKKNK